MPINVFTTLDDPSGVDTTVSDNNAEVRTAMRLPVDTSFTEQQR
jgi:hypothetical protein